MQVFPKTYILTDLSVKFKWHDSIRNMKIEETKQLGQAKVTYTHEVWRFLNLTFEITAFAEGAYYDIPSVSSYSMPTFYVATKEGSFKKFDLPDLKVSSSTPNSDILLAKWDWRCSGRSIIADPTSREKPYSKPGGSEKGSVKTEFLFTGNWDRYAFMEKYSVVKQEWK